MLEELLGAGGVQQGGGGTRGLTCVHVAAVVAAEAPPAPAPAADVAASATAPHVGRWGHVVVHGAAHPETRVVLLGGGQRGLLI